MIAASPSLSDEDDARKGSRSFCGVGDVLPSWWWCSCDVALAIARLENGFDDNNSMCTNSLGLQE